MIEQYSRIRRFFMAALILEFICMLVELKAALTTAQPLFWFFTGLILSLVVVLANIVYKCSRKIRSLRLH